MATLKLKNVNKIYPNGAHAVIDFNLEIEDKDFVVLVGPSGCGKSTTLRMIAGLEDISSGEVYIDDTLVNELEPKDREIAMVFQSYALYPHLSVFENLAYGLKIKKTPIREIEDKVVKTAKVLDLLELLDRKPAELSGGQRQRVALGRAIIRDAKVFLMDEPLSNLDAKLRVQTRSELINLHRELGNTTIYVTHDQVEAMTMATKIVVMSEGLVEQVGEPELLYNYPNNTFVGGFIGTPPMNFIKTKVCKDGYVKIFDCKIKVADEKIDIIKENDMYDKDIILGIRPEDIHEATSDKSFKDDSCMKSKVVFSEILGSETNVYYNLNGSEVISKIEDAKDFKVGEEVKIFLDMKKAHFFDVESGNRLSSVKEQEARNNLIKILRK